MLRILNKLRLILLLWQILGVNLRQKRLGLSRTPRLKLNLPLHQGTRLASLLDLVMQLKIIFGESLPHLACRGTGLILGFLLRTAQLLNVTVGKLLGMDHVRIIEHRRVGVDLHFAFGVEHTFHRRLAALTRGSLQFRISEVLAHYLILNLALLHSVRLVYLLHDNFFLRLSQIGRLLLVRLQLHVRSRWASVGGRLTRYVV